MGRTRTAFARRDLIAVFAVSALAAGVALPAVRRASEKAALAACRDNLRKAGAAVLAYEQTSHHIPPASLDTPGTRRGWVTFVLPQLGQEALARKFRADADWFDAVNASVTATPIETLRCPAAPERRFSAGATDEAKWRGATGDYAAMEGLDGSVIASLSLPAEFDRNGLFRDRETTRLADVEDGLGTTFMLVENAGRPHAWRKGKRQANDLAAEEGVWASRQFKLQPRGHTADGTAYPGPCAVNCSNFRGVYSFHPGMAHACFADGSVRPLGERLDIHVFYAMVTIRGGEVIAPND